MSISDAQVFYRKIREKEKAKKEDAFAAGRHLVNTTGRKRWVHRDEFITHVKTTAWVDEDCAKMVLANLRNTGELEYDWDKGARHPEYDADFEHLPVIV